MYRQRRIRLDRGRIFLMILCLMALCLVIVGSITGAWADFDEKGTRGLWQMCAGDDCKGIDLSSIPGWLFMVQIIFAVGKILTLLVFIGSIVLVKKPNIKIWYLSIASIITAIVLMIGLALYNNNQDSPLAYSFFLATLGSFVLIIVFLASLMNHCQRVNSRSRLEEPKVTAADILQNRLIATSRDMLRDEDLTPLSRL